MATLSALAEDYFRSMSSLSKKIYEDLEETKNAYEDIWLSLTEKEKAEIQNESIIKSELSLKYALLDNFEFDLNNPPIKYNDLMSFFGREHSSKTIHDETTNVTWKDEHSGPFMFHTKSQLNLCELSKERCTDLKAASPNPASELEISHSKVVFELKNALKKQELKSFNADGDRGATISPTNLLSKFMSNFKAKSEDTQNLVSRETSDHTAGLSSSIFSNIFTSPQKDQKHSSCFYEKKRDSSTFCEKEKDSSTFYEKEYRKSAIKSNSDLSEENHGLLSNASLNSSGTDFHSCDDGSPEKNKSSETITTGFSRCGFDFLDNW